MLQISELKQQLYDLCAAYIANREAAIKQTIADARDAANNDTKSSAGDKYETGREMMQQEIDLNTTRLNELNQLKHTLERIKPGNECSNAQPGAIIQTNNGSYYIAIGAGQLKVSGVIYYAISASSPIGARLMGLKAGDTFMLNGKEITIQKVT